MLQSQVRRIQEAYPSIYLACHRRHVRQDETDATVTDHQLSILNHLHRTKGKKLSRLAEHFGVSRSTMSITAARLVRRGYVVRSIDQKDARCVHLTLTAEGNRLREQNSALDPRLIKALLRFLPAEEVESSLRGLERLAVGAEKLMGSRRKGG